MTRKILVPSGVPVTYMGPPNNHFIISPSRKGMHYTYGSKGTRLKVFPEDIELRPDLFVPDLASEGKPVQPPIQAEVSLAAERTVEVGEEDEPDSEDEEANGAADEEQPEVEDAPVSGTPSPKPAKRRRKKTKRT
jgi:hypothetical protein